MKLSYKKHSLAALLGMALLASNACGADFLIDRDKVDVTAPPAVPEAKFTVRLKDIAEVTKIQATVGGKEVKAAHKTADEGKTSVYYLIDVSEQQKGTGFAKEACDAVAYLSDSLLADGKAQTLFQVGIGTIGSKHKHFAFDLSTHDGRAAVLDKAAKEKDGTSEIYRCALEGLEQFKGQPGTGRKVLFLLSSGKSADTDKTRNSAEALVAAANKEGISIHVVAFSKDAGGTSNWQALRYVATETAGSFSEVITSLGSKPTSANSEMYGRLKAVVAVTVDLKEAPSGKQPLVVNLDLNNGKKLKIEKEIEVPAGAAPVPQPGEKPAKEPVTPPGDGSQQSGNQVAPVSPSPSRIIDQPWFMPTAIGGGVLVLGLLAFLFYKANSSGGDTIVDFPEPVVYEPTGPIVREGGDILGNAIDPLKHSEDNFGGDDPTRLVIGFLEEYDLNNQMVRRHEISRANFTIGRSSDSSLRFQDDSVSVNHANIHRRSDRSLEITDLRSINQTRVNGKPVEHCVLKDGDKIELGKIRLKLVMKNGGVLS